MPDTDYFPKIQSCTRLGSNHRIFDAKFYPFALPDNDYIFAAVAETDVYICRPKLDANPPYDILSFFRDSQAYGPDGVPASFNSCVWTKDSTTGNPLLCLAGSKPKQIKILDIESGKVVRELSGHGRGINDLAISPLSTDYLVSCAEDGTIRVWNLSPEYEDQPCVALLGGGGHKQPILAIHFHPNGRWLLSGGIDTAVALWAVPSIEELESRRKTTSDPLIVYYPHFFSDEVHSNYVDSLAFYGDLIISRAASDPKIRKTINEILIWKIDGFDSDDPAPLEPAIPIVGKNTLSSFPHEEGFRGFRRIATLSMPSTERFYQRFGLFHKPDKRPLLAMGNHVSRFYFFDLQKLEEGTDIREYKGKARRGGSRGGRGAYRGTAAAISSSTAAASRSSEDVHMTGTGTPESFTTPVPSERVLELGDPFRMRKPDHTVTADTKLSARMHFGTSQIAWSPDGTWMVGVGDYGMMTMFHRNQAAVEK